MIEKFTALAANSFLEKKRDSLVVFIYWPKRVF